jgi:hypothetical protein
VFSTGVKAVTGFRKKFLHGKELGEVVWFHLQGSFVIFTNRHGVISQKA